MNLFSPNAFLLGTVIAAVLIFGGNAIYLLLCRAFKVRVLEFTTFYKLWLPLHSKTIGQTKYILGWVPTGSYIKVFGMNMPMEERKQIPVEDLQYALFTKPRWVKILLRSVPFVLIALLLGVTMASLSGALGWMETVKAYRAYIGDAFSAMFTDSVSHEHFLATTKVLLADNSPTVFAMALFAVFWTICLPLGWIMYAIAWGGEKGYRALSVIGWVALLPMMWLIFWKVPSFVFSFFSWSEIFIHSANVLVGVLFTGIVLHLLMLATVKLATPKL